MKLLILTSDYPCRTALHSGVFVHQQVKALQQLGVECHVLVLRNWYPPFGLHKLHAYWTTGYKHRQNNFEEYEGVKIHSIPMFIKMPTRFFRESYYQRAVRSLARYLRNSKELRGADWLYAQFFIDNGYIAAKLKEQFPIKVAAIALGDDVHAWPEQNPALIPHIQYIYSHADLVLANSKRLAADALKLAGDHKPDIQTVYGGINHSLFRRPQLTPQAKAELRKKFDLPTNKRILLCIARNEYLKGWNELLQSIAENKELLNDWVLLAITSNDHSRYSIDIRAVVSELGIEDKVIVRGFMPHDQVKQLYWASDAFILPSYNEGLSNAVMEAMASGLWVIATDVGGHAEIITDGNSGFLIPARSKEAIIKTLQYLVTNFDTQNDTISKQAVAAIRNMGDYSTNAKKLLDLLNDSGPV